MEALPLRNVFLSPIGFVASTRRHSRSPCFWIRLGEGADPALPEVFAARTPKTSAPEVFAAKTRKTSSSSCFAGAYTPERTP
jgi:hypothetical protein